MLVLRRPCEILTQCSLTLSPSEMKAKKKKKNHRGEGMRSCNLLAFTNRPKDDGLELTATCLDSFVISTGICLSKNVCRGHSQGGLHLFSRFLVNRGDSKFILSFSFESGAVH